MQTPEEVFISDSIRIDISSKVDTTFNFVPGGDVIVISAFFDGDWEPLDFLQVRNLDYFVSKLWKRNKNELLEDFNDRIISSPLFKAVSAMWSVGARNILIVNAGLDSDIPTTTFKDKWDFIYSKTKEALEHATDYAFVSMIYSVDAKYELVTDGTDSYDFLGLMADVCAKAISKGNIVQSVLSTQNNSVTNILSDETLVRKNAWQNEYCKTTVRGATYFVPNNDKYRFVSVVTGYATISINYNGIVFQDGLAPTVMGLMSILDDDIAVSGRIIKAVRLPKDLSQSEADQLSIAGFIPMSGTVRSRRGLSDEVRAMADNNMGVVRSELRQTGVLRLTRRIAYKVKSELEQYIGTKGDGTKASIKTVMDGYKKRGIIRRYNFKISRPPNDPHKILIFIQFLPYFSAKVIEISIISGSSRS